MLFSNPLRSSVNSQLKQAKLRISRLQWRSVTWRIWVLRDTLILGIINGQERQTQESG